MKTPRQRQPRPLAPRPRAALPQAANNARWWKRWLTAIRQAVPKRITFKRMLIATPILVGTIGLMSDVLGLFDRGTGLFNPSSAVATKSDVAEILRQLAEMRRGAQPAIGVGEIDSETERMLADLLGEGSTPFQLVVRQLKGGKVDDAIATLERLADADRSANSADTRAPSDKLYLAGLLALRSRPPQAEALLRRALALSPARSDVRAMLAIALLHQGRVSEAGATLDQAPGSLQDYLILNVNGLIAFQRGDYPDAERWFRASLQAGRREGSRAAQAAALGNLGNVRSRLGDIEGSKRYYQLSIAINKGDKPSLDANQYCNLGHEALSRNDLTAAKNYYQLSFDVITYAADKSCLANTLMGLGIVSMKQEAFPEAETYFRQARDSADQLSQAANQLATRTNLSVVLQIQHKKGWESELLSALSIALRQPRDTAAFDQYVQMFNFLLFPSAGLPDAASVNGATETMLKAEAAGDLSPEQAIQLRMGIAVAAYIAQRCDLYKVEGEQVLDAALARHDAQLAVVFSEGILAAEKKYGAKCPKTKLLPPSLATSIFKPL